MGLFGGKRNRERRPQLATPEELASIGRAVYGSPGVPTAPIEASRYYLPVLEENGFATPGTPRWGTVVGIVVEGLRGPALESGDGWALIGAFHVACDLLGNDVSDPRYGELVDEALLALRDAKVSYAAVPPFALERWYSQYGMDGLAPADWSQG